MYKKIEMLMISKHINKAELARAIGVSPGNVGDWAAGRSSPSIEKSVKIADYFHVTMDYLCDRDDKYPVVKSDALEMMKLYNELDQEGKTIVYAAILTQKQRMEAEEAQKE